MPDCIYCSRDTHIKQCRCCRKGWWCALCEKGWYYNYKAERVYKMCCPKADPVPLYANVPVT